MMYTEYFSNLPDDGWNDEMVINPVEKLKTVPNKDFLNKTDEMKEAAKRSDDDNEIDISISSGHCGPDGCDV